MLARPPAQASHRTVARLLGLATFEGAGEEGITVPSKRSFQHEGVVVHWSRDITYVPPVLIAGIRCRRARCGAWP